MAPSPRTRVAPGSVTSPQGAADSPPRERRFLHPRGTESPRPTGACTPSKGLSGRPVGTGSCGYYGDAKLLVQVREVPASDPGAAAPHMSQDSPLSVGSLSGGSGGPVLNLRRP